MASKLLLVLDPSSPSCFAASRFAGAGFRAFAFIAAFAATYIQISDIKLHSTAQNEFMNCIPAAQSQVLTAPGHFVQVGPHLQLSPHVQLPSRKIIQTTQLDNTITLNKACNEINLDSMESPAFQIFDNFQSRHQTLKSFDRWAVLRLYIVAGVKGETGQKSTNQWILRDLHPDSGCGHRRLGQCHSTVERRNDFQRKKKQLTGMT